MDSLDGYAATTHPGMDGVSDGDVTTVEIVADLGIAVGLPARRSSSQTPKPRAPVPASGLRAN